MISTIAKTNNNVMKRAFFVRDKNLNEDGTLDTCTILNEIASLNDKVILNTYGYLDYDNIITWHYHFSISGEAGLDDVIELESRYLVTEDALEIKLSVQKRIGPISEMIAEGSFVFKPAA